MLVLVLVLEMTDAGGDGRSEAGAGEAGELGDGGGIGGGGIALLRFIALEERETGVEKVADGMMGEEREEDAAGSSQGFMRWRAQGSRVSPGEVVASGERTDSERTRAVRA